MLDATDILKMLVGLKQVDDLDVVSSEAVLSSVCSLKNRTSVLKMASIVDQLLDVFDYELSPEFATKLNGKSAEVQAMHRKLLSPDRRKHVLERFGRALTELLDSREAYDLVPADNHGALDELRTLALSIGGGAEGGEGKGNGKGDRYI